MRIMEKYVWISKFCCIQIHLSFTLISHKLFEVGMQRFQRKLRAKHLLKPL